jgi:hypothetical protein
MSGHFVGIGGFEHDGRFVHLVAVRADGKIVAEATRARGLSTQDCLKVFRAISKRDHVFCFQGDYLATQVLRSAGDAFQLFSIFHPESRRTQRGTRTITPLVRVGPMGYTADSSGLTVAFGPPTNGRWKRTVRVWDIHTFSRRSLPDSLEAWGLKGAPSDNTAAACQTRCQRIAELAKAVLAFASQLGDMKGRYRGIGSIAAVLMRDNGVEQCIGDLPAEVEDAARRAYFGGRQDIAVQGPVREPLFEYDVTSAYAWAMKDLPCLACGTWRRAAFLSDLETADIAIVRFKNGPRPGGAIELPCRVEEGVVYGSNFNGWSHWREVSAALYGVDSPNPDVYPSESWVYKTSCSHRPFAFLEALYTKRKALETKGAIGPAELLKHVLVAAYGKLVQRIASPWQSIVWAGMATSHVRARVIRDVPQGPRRRRLSVATDAVITRDELLTGTGLGDWTLKTKLSHGAFFVAPGHVFKLGGKLDAEDGAILSAWEKRGTPEGVAATSERHFVTGAEATCSMVRCRQCGESWDYADGIMCKRCQIVAGVPRAAVLDSFGKWVVREHTVSFLDDRRSVGMDLGGRESLPFTGGGVRRG